MAAHGNFCILFVSVGPPADARGGDAAVGSTNRNSPRNRPEMQSRMQTLIDRTSRSHVQRTSSTCCWRITGQEKFQEVLEQGIEVKTHWAGERFWWRRVVYVRPDVVPICLQIERTKESAPTEKHRIALAEILSVRRAPGEIRTIEIVHGGSAQGRLLGIELPTPRVAGLLQQRLLSLLSAMEVLRHERTGHQSSTTQSNAVAQYATPSHLSRRVAAQGHARSTDG